MPKCRKKGTDPTGCCFLFRKRATETAHTYLRSSFRARGHPRIASSSGGTQFSPSRFHSNDQTENGRCGPSCCKTVLVMSIRVYIYSSINRHSAVAVKPQQLPLLASSMLTFLPQPIRSGNHPRQGFFHRSLSLHEDLTGCPARAYLFPPEELATVYGHPPHSCSGDRRPCR